MKILTLVGVALLGVASANHSEVSVSEPQPISDPENEETRQMETPEVVLQLKYDEGELKRIYLAQFRKPGKVSTPSVSDRSNLCADLCHAGLGGSVCGPSCSQLIPLGLHSALVDNSTEDSDVGYGRPRVAVCPALCNNFMGNTVGGVDNFMGNTVGGVDNFMGNTVGGVDNSTEDSDVGYGRPRVAVCPALCDNFMGEPLCQCQQHDKYNAHQVNWTEVCDAFCADGYTLTGCVTCEGSTSSPELMLTSSRALATAAGWSAWCDVQCSQGHGGAACNCDRTPFQ